MAKEGSAISSYVVLIERSADGYGVWCPDLPGCVAVGDTVEETVSAMHEAIAIHIDGLREDGQQVPPSATVSATIEDLKAARTGVRLGGSSLRELVGEGRA